MTIIFRETDIEPWELPHMNDRPNDTLRFPRAARDNCLRAADPVQGPYRSNCVTHAGHHAVVWVSIVGLVIVVGTLGFHALARYFA